MGTWQNSVHTQSDDKYFEFGDVTYTDEALYANKLS